MPNAVSRKRRLSADMLHLAAGAGASAVLVALGGALASALPAHAPWLSVAAWLAPSGLAFAAYWWATQKS
jgi:hypothetical protein